MDSIYDIIGDPQYAEYWADNREELDPPIINFQLSYYRCYEENDFGFPPEFITDEGEFRIVVSGSVPTIVDNRNGFDCVYQGGERYMLFCPEGTNGAVKDYGDNGTWHGEPTRDDDVRNEANEAWLEWVESSGA